MGISFPFLSSLLLQSCSRDESIFPTFTTQFKGKVIIVGAGAAGMAAGYLLKRYGVDFEILEAAPVHGGRLKKAADFADFPIDIGAEWIHTHPRILADIINNPNIDANVEILVYNPKTIQTWKNGELKSHNYIRNFYSEWKFKDSTWFDFFQQYIYPEVADKIRLSTPVVDIQYGADKSILTTAQNLTYEADRILITTPIKMLQQNRITFQPALPATHTEAIQKIYVGDGIKIFIECKEKFYPDILAFGNIFQALEEEEKFVYDAAFGKDSNRHILGLFAINDKAKAYTQLNSESEIIQAFLAELDEIFDGKATQNYVKHIIQNWSGEPYIGGAYSYAFDGDQNDIVNTLNTPVQNKIYFAGEAQSVEHQATVHGACASAYSMIANMMKE